MIVSHVMDEVRILCAIFFALPPVVERTPHSIDEAKDDCSIDIELSLFSEFSVKQQ